VRILVATSYVPFAPGGADTAADALVAALAVHRPDVTVDRVRLPRGAHAALAARLTDLSQCDRLVAVGEQLVPLRHPGLRVWDPAAEPTAAAIGALLR
jgi:hypothetical protein